MSFSTERTTVTWTTVGAPRRRSRRLPLLLLVLPLVFGLFGSPAGVSVVHGDELAAARSKQTQLNRQIAAQKAEVARLNSLQASLSREIRQTSSQLKAINTDLAAVRSRIGRMEARIEVVQETYDGLVVELAGLETELVEIQAEEATKRSELRQRKNLLAERIRAAYENQRTSLLESLLSGDTFTDVLAEMSYLIDVGEHDKALAEQIVKDQETLAALHELVIDTWAHTNELRKETEAQERELARSLTELKEARAQLRKLEKETEKALAQQRATYAKMARNKAAAEKAIREAAAAERQLKKKIDALIAKQASQGRIPSEYNGTLRWPMSGTITQNFGCTGFSWEPPLGDCPHFHKGIDIAAPMYTPVKAAGPGTVVFAGANPYDPHPKAWIVIIAHSQNLATWYAHLDNAVKPPRVKAGDVVRTGDVIAYNGMTGRTTGPHLHWMVQLNGAFVNPRLFL
jgi:murein DD-endopeptidase MepM/ murein hydrolase activator NlpD